MHHLDIHKYKQVCKKWHRIAQAYFDINNREKIKIKVNHEFRQDYNGRPRAWVLENGNILLRTIHFILHMIHMELINMEEHMSLMS